MGGIFQGPSQPPASAPAPAPAPLPNPNAGQKQARLDAMDRHRRGRAGTVTTSEHGLVRKKTNASKKKSLLGE